MSTFLELFKYLRFQYLLALYFMQIVIFKIQLHHVLTLKSFIAISVFLACIPSSIGLNVQQPMFKIYFAD